MSAATRAPSLIIPLATLISCAVEPRSPAPAPVVAPAPPPIPPAPSPALFPPAPLVIPRAEASPPLAFAAPRKQASPLRTEGKRHALARTRDGVIVMSEERGVLGALASPEAGAEIRWAGLVDDDAVLMVTTDALHRAATVDEAIAGKSEKIAALDPAATMMASAGKLVVAAAPEAGGAYLESRDGGRRWKREKRPAEGPIAQVAVRADGVVVAAIERAKVRNSYGAEGVLAEIMVSRRAGAWTAGPTAEALYGPPITQHGDTLWVSAKQENTGQTAPRALDAQGRWIDFVYPEAWLSWNGWGASFSLHPPTPRPGFPRAPAPGKGGVGGLLGGLGAGCGGVFCVTARALVTVEPAASAFGDGACRAEDVIERKEDISYHEGSARKHDTWVRRECDAAAAPRRAATLVVHGAPPRFVRLPSTCGSGRVLAGDHAVFVRCDDKHRGRPALLHLAPSGALVEVMAGPVDLDRAATASDGTTVMIGDKRALLCRAGDRPSCIEIPREGLLAARPLPGGRALLARRGADDHDLVLELLGEPAATPVRALVAGNLLDLAVTAQGHVRLWTSPSLRYMPSGKAAREERDRRRLFAYRVQTDGALALDPEAMEALGPAQK